jgi:hypothetical protein
MFEVRLVTFPGFGAFSVLLRLIAVGGREEKELIDEAGEKTSFRLFFSEFGVCF